METLELKTRQRRGPREGSQHPGASLWRARGLGSQQKGLNKARVLTSTLVPTAHKPIARPFPLAGGRRASGPLPAGQRQLTDEGAARKEGEGEGMWG